MTYIIAPHEVREADKLEAVKTEMQARGECTIRAYWDGEAYHAIEGSHRLAAAEALEIEIEIEEVDADDVITDHDLYDLPNETTVADIIDYLGGKGPYYSL